MKCSHNELTALIKKAAMGSGYSEGMAKEISHAALCLPSGNAEAALSCLKATSGWSVAKNGAYLFDTALMALSENTTQVWEQSIDHVDCPKLLEGMALSANYNYGLISELKTHEAQTKISIKLGEIIARPIINGPIDVPEDVYEALNIFAKKTYVPATEASRLKGAGAGLTDND